MIKTDATLAEVESISDLEGGAQYVLGTAPTTEGTEDTYTVLTSERTDQIANGTIVLTDGVADRSAFAGKTWLLSDDQENGMHLFNDNGDFLVANTKGGVTTSNSADDLEAGEISWDDGDVLIADGTYKIRYDGINAVLQAVGDTESETPAIVMYKVVDLLDG